jgi:hypothetical protein
MVIGFDLYDLLEVNKEYEYVIYHLIISQFLFSFKKPMLAIGFHIIILAP